MEEKKLKTKNNKKRNIIIIIVSFVVLLVILFLLWFFNRKFEVTFDYNNGTSNDVIYVKYNKKIDKENVKDKEELGDKFIDWYLVIDVKDNEDVLDEKPFDFDKKISEKIKLKAVYDGTPDTITITFDSKGGSKVSPITINKGAELKLPKNPTYSGYTFNGWVDKNNKPVTNNALLSEDTTLYAVWKKNTVKPDPKPVDPTPVKPEPTPVEPKPEEPKKEEKISLTLSNYYISRYGTSTSKASASVENASGAVTYSISSSRCVEIDSSTGSIKAKETVRGETTFCSTNGEVVTVTASLPSGKSASKTLTFEKLLVLTVNNKEIDRFSEKLNDNYFYNSGDSGNKFTIYANQDVEWVATGVIERESAANKTTYIGKSNPDKNTSISATTKGGQKVNVICYSAIN